MFDEDSRPLLEGAACRARQEGRIDALPIGKYAQTVQEHDERLHDARKLQTQIEAELDSDPTQA